MRVYQDMDLRIHVKNAVWTYNPRCVQPLQPNDGNNMQNSEHFYYNRNLQIHPMEYCKFKLTFQKSGYYSIEYETLDLTSQLTDVSSPLSSRSDAHEGYIYWG